jgi:hypothetical protein
LDERDNEHLHAGCNPWRVVGYRSAWTRTGAYRPGPTLCPLNLPTGLGNNVIPCRHSSSLQRPIASASCSSWSPRTRWARPHETGSVPEEHRTSSLGKARVGFYAKYNAVTKSPPRQGNSTFVVRVHWTPYTLVSASPSAGN